MRKEPIPGCRKARTPSDDLAGADVVAVTHAGYDHRAQAIDIVQAGQAVLASGTALYTVAVDSGVPAERCAGMVPGVTFTHGDATLKAIDAGRHTSNLTYQGQFIADEPLNGPVNTTWLPPDEAAIAAEWLGARRVIPVHYAPGDPAPAELTQALADRGSDIEVITLEFGQT